eukprot:scaffold68348_cov17-Prasinocladus_malaysianus.AAC.1
MYAYAHFPARGSCQLYDDGYLYQGSLHGRCVRWIIVGMMIDHTVFLSRAAALLLTMKSVGLALQQRARLTCSSANHAFCDVHQAFAGHRQPHISRIAKRALESTHSDT